MLINKNCVDVYFDYLSSGAIIVFAKPPAHAPDTKLMTIVELEPF